MQESLRVRIALGKTDPAFSRNCPGRDAHGAGQKSASRRSLRSPFLDSFRVPDDTGVTRSVNYFARAGALRKLTRLPMSVGFRVGQGMPNSSARSIMRGPCRQRAAVNEILVKASFSDLSPGPIFVPSAVWPWQAAQPRSEKTLSPTRSSWLEVPQARKERPQIRHFVVLKNRRRNPVFASLSEHRGCVVPQNAGKLPRREWKITLWPQLWTHTAALPAHGMALYASVSSHRRLRLFRSNLSSSLIPQGRGSM